MKTKQTFMIAMAAAWALFGVGMGRAQSAADKTYLEGNIRIESIKKVVPGDGDPNLPLSQGTTPQIYFDVKLADVNASSPTRWMITGNSYSSNGTKRPYLVLNIPLKGTSSKDGISPLNSNESNTEETTTAVAYYMGQGRNKDTLRFVYNVRPGDIVEAISWATTADGHVSVGGEISEITLTAQTVAGTPIDNGVGMSQACMIGQSGTPALDTGDGRDWPVSGYTLTIGEQGNRNYGKLYHGLVPFTVTTPADALPVGFTNSALVNQCYVWVERIKEDGKKEYMNVSVTPMTKGTETIVEVADPQAVTVAAFDESGFFTGPSAAAGGEGTFTAQRFYLNIPQGILAGETVRVCYGVRDDGTVAGLPTNVFAYVEGKIEESPLTANQASYEVLSSDMVDGDFELATEITAGLTDDANAPLATGATVKGGTIVAAAGETVTVFIRKTALDTIRTAGKLYAAVQQISSTNAGRVTWAHHDVEMDPDAQTDYAIEFTIAANASGGITEYRIHVPGLKNTGKDQSFYLQIESTPKRETINLTPAEGNTGIATEFLQTGTTQEGETSFLQYTLTVPVDNTKKRTFLIFPITDEGYDIDKTSTINVNGEEMNALEAIGKYVVLQNQGVNLSLSSTPTLKVSVEKGQTSATFYVAAVNDYTKERVLTGAQVTMNDSILGSGKTGTLGDIVFSAASCNALGVITGKNDECDIKVTPYVQNRAPAIISSNPPANGALNSPVRFNFTANDVASDYLIAQMNFGDGETQTLLYANDDVMEGLLGVAGWEAELANIANTYGLNVDDIKENGKYRRDRNGKATQSNISFEHTYTSGATPTWTLTVIDSSGASVSSTGTLTLSTEQMFQFYTWSKTTGGLGYVLWGTQTPGDPGHMGAWSFGPNYTFTTMAKSGGNTLVTVQAVPLAAGAANPGYTEATVSKLYDSFFYKWSATSEYAELLPTGDDPNQNVYSRVISFGRDFVKGGGGGDGGASEWSDIVLSAVFVREYLGGDYDDANANAAKAQWPEWTTDEPYLFDLGDYNTDGVPDGWVLKTFGATDGRAKVEGASMAGEGATGSTTTTQDGTNGTITVTITDNFPALGWAGADGVYRSANATGTPVGSFALTGTVYDYKTRLRGRDEALNAATGPLGELNAGEWISAPQWIVKVRKDFTNKDGDVVYVEGTKFAYAMAGTLRERQNDLALWTDAGYTQIKLANTSKRAGSAITTGSRGIYYATDVLPANELGDQAFADWRYVVDEAGIPVYSGATRADGSVAYHSANVLVNVNEESPDYECVIALYAAWAYDHYATDGSRLADQLVDELSLPGIDPLDEDVTPARPVMFPYGTQMETYNALFREANDGKVVLRRVDSVGGADGFGHLVLEAGLVLADGTSGYHYCDFRLSAGQLLDEPFKPVKNNFGVIDPRLTCWLERATTSADQDGDGLPNALEYFFWYYASRIAYGPVRYVVEYEYDDEGNETVKRDDDGNIIYTHVAVDGGVWPAIDMTDRMRTNAQQWGGGASFALGRKYRMDFDPRLDYAGEGDASGNNPYTTTGNSTHCKGNFWDPISADDVLNAFNPLVASSLADPDNDGLGVMEEIAIGTNPIDCDTDNDYMPDGWEVYMGTDPTVSDGDANPDGDYFACVSVITLPDYKHGYAFNYNIANDVYAMESANYRLVTWIEGSGSVSWTELEDGAPVTKTMAYDFNRIRDTDQGDAKVWYEPGTTGYAQLRDHEVYEAFGFDPMTAWTGDTTVANRVFYARNTRPFTSKEEFFSGVLRTRAWKGATWDQLKAWSTNPTKADTNGDGVPDGWSAYVGGDLIDHTGAHPGEIVDEALFLTGDADGDGLTGAEEFACVAAGNAPEGWTNKVLPSDPFNPDTDFDGLWDGDEGNEMLLAAGGGCDPTTMDTDGDGMTDGWEYRWFSGTAGDGTPNPMAANDASRDPDRDGLPNYQEYLTGMLRQTRYDLGPDAARLYKDRPGVRTWNASLGTGRFEWAKVADLPDVYTAGMDLGNPGLIPSDRYYMRNLLGNEAVPEIYYVHPLSQALAEYVSYWVYGTGSTAYNYAVSLALSRVWNRTLLLPDADSLLIADTDGVDQAVNEEGEQIGVEAALKTFSDSIHDYRNYLLAISPNLNAGGAGAVALLESVIGDEDKGYSYENPRDPAAVKQIATLYDAAIKNAQALKARFALYRNPLDSAYRTFSSLLGALAEDEMHGLGAFAISGFGTDYAWNFIETLALQGEVVAASVNGALQTDLDMLRTSAQRLDFAFGRLMRADPLETDSATVMGYITTIDAQIKALQDGLAMGQGYYPARQGWIDEWCRAGGGMEALWKARREQILHMLSKKGVLDSGHMTFRTSLVGRMHGKVPFPANLNYGLEAPYPEGFAEAVAKTDAPDAYEAAIRKSEAPFILEQYRQAIRGFNGGLWSQPTRGDYHTFEEDSNLTGYAESLYWPLNPGANGDTVYPIYRKYLAPIGYHHVILPFDAYKGNTEGRDPYSVRGRQAMSRNLTDYGESVVLFGLPLVSREPMGADEVALRMTISVGGNCPMVRNGKTEANAASDLVYEDPFVTTSPRVPDTDLDGMDDYWEIFHGLNPLLGPISEDSAETNYPFVDAVNYSTDKIAESYHCAGLGWLYNIRSCFPHGHEESIELSPAQVNPFLNDPLRSGSVTGYDYYSYPWMAGVPEADPDGDGLTNYQETVNGFYPESRSGTDPSPLWMTDPSNANSFARRFYSLLNANVLEETTVGGEGQVDDHGVSGSERTDYWTLNWRTMAFPYVVGRTGGLLDNYPIPTDSVLPYEINEGYDTDGDGTPDLVEQTNDNILSGDAQALRSPDRQQSAYFAGKGVMQSRDNTRFGPMALLKFSVECWIKPDAGQTGEQILIDRPWRFDESTETKASQIRHNFQVGLSFDATSQVYLPFVRYTGTATALQNGTVVSTGEPQLSPTAKAASGMGVKAGEWSHIAATYDGSTLRIYVNGVKADEASSRLEPANGAISLHAYPNDDVTLYTYRKAPLMIGATPADGWFASSAKLPDDAAFEDLYASAYHGYIDEVRIWDGARTDDQIRSNYRLELTQAELEANRLTAFTTRYNGNGFYQALTEPELLALFTFDDIPAGTRQAGTVEPEGTPWEIYPGQKTVGGETVPGSFLYRRKGLKASAEAQADRPSVFGVLPAAEEVHTSYYATLPAVLRGTMYTETEFVPMAHNTVAHLPLMDVERDYPWLLAGITYIQGSPKLVAPSGSVADLKPADSVYWTPHAAGTNVTATVSYPGVRTTGNPYGYRYVSTITFDPVNYLEFDAYSTMPSADLLLLGDVFAKYDRMSWTGSPSTDPASALAENNPEKPGEDGFSTWFDRDGESNMTVGGKWLYDNFGAGSTYDADGDGMPNWWESYYGLDPRDATGSNGPHGDDDGDYLTNYAEYMARSNPNKESTLGNGVPDFHVPQWSTRGERIFGLLYTDNDFMEDHWEAAYANVLSVDRNDAWNDPDNDGWSNWSEARYIGYGRRSTNPGAIHTSDNAGNRIAEYPQPALSFKIDYEGSVSDLETAESVNIVLHAYSESSTSETPDATFIIPFRSASGSTTGSITMGSMQIGTVSGYMMPGTICRGSIKVRDARTALVSGSTIGQGWLRYYEWSDGAVNHNPRYGQSDSTSSTGTENQLVLVDTYLFYDNGSGALVGATGAALSEESKVTHVTVGTVDYESGAVTLALDNTMPGVFADGGAIGDSTLTISYSYLPTDGFPCNYTVRDAAEGHLREGINRFFLFLDKNGNGVFDPGEPAGTPDVLTTDVGWDKNNRTLHVTLTDAAAPGFVRVPTASLLASAQTAKEGQDGEEAKEPFVYDPNAKYILSVTQVADSEGALPAVEVYTEPYDGKKPYVYEAQIAETYPNGLPARTKGAFGATTYKVFLYPEEMEDSEDIAALEPYCIGMVTNVYSSFERKLASLEHPAAGEYLHNTSVMKVRWTADVRVPSFDLTLWKTKALKPAAKGDETQGENAFETLAEPAVVFQGTDLPCGTPVESTAGRPIYEYDLSHLLGTLAADGKTYIGDGEYAVSIRLKPYNADPIDLGGSVDSTDVSGKRIFRVVMREAGVERTDAWYPRQESNFLPVKVYYTGSLLSGDAEKDALLKKNGSRLRIEAHYSASFNGVAAASVDDLLDYDEALGEAAGYNPYVSVTKDKIRPAGNANGAFWRTAISAQLRGLCGSEAVYLIAYFDVNGNGKRDRWEPWGYYTAGKSAPTGNYFDPQTVAPILSGTEAVASFYIQDVDIDNNKVVDVLEHTSMGGNKTFEPGETVDPNDPTDPEGPKHPGGDEPDPESPETPDPDDPNGPKDEDGNAVSTWFDYDPDSPVTDTPQTSVGASWLKTVVYAQSNALRDTDFDNDGLPTWWENYYGLDPQSDKGEDGPYVDTDVDGLPNFAEFRARANPLRASTLGTGTPDAQVPQWNTRGAPTLGLLYTDGDFMEEKWEAKNGVSIDQHDAALDPDADGWSNWAEVRAALSPDGKRTAPTYTASATAGDDYPRPSLTLKADYFEALTVTNATLVIQGFADSTGGGAPDVVFSTPYLGNGALHTVQVPIAGHLREGKNNFFIFLDLDGNGAWDEDEPAGVPDQHDVDIGFDTTGTTLHTALTRLAPPGSVRVNVKPILDQLVNEAETGTVESVDGSSLMNPSTGKPLDPTKFPVGVGMNYYLLLTPFENIAGSEPSQNSEVVVYKELYNSQKPYLTENDIFAASASGLPGTEAKNQLATSYKVWLVPENVYNAGGSVPTWTDYNIAVVTNYFGRLDEDNAVMVSPKGGAVQNNPELTFEWKSNVQVPTFTLKIQKIRDASGASITSTEVYNATVRGVSPAAMEGSVSSGQQQYRYRYTLPRGVGELSPNGATLFGNGSYTYTLSLNPYNGTSKVLEGAFNIGLNDSATPGMSEGGANYKVADSYYVRTKIRYNGVLTTDEDFDGARIIVEAYRTPAFVGNPTAAVSDLLVHDADNAEVAKLNPYVVMSKDRKILKGGKEQFWSTAFDVEIRGLPSADPIYLMAYFDLNGNGQRDVWEPWGYAYTGAASLDGYYYDPVGVQPRLQGSDIAVEFYVQDVDTDSDKLADSWEWLQGRQSGQDVTGDFSKWCDNYIGGSYAGGSGVALWTTDANGNRALTAYGAQLFGLRTYGVDATSGAVSLSEDASENALLNTLDPAAIGQLQGADFNIAVSGISVADERLNLSWKLMATSAPASTGRSRARAAVPSTPTDVTETVANAANEKAVYAVRGKVNLSDEKWDLLKTIPVGGESTPSITCEGKEYRFFKVDYQPSAKAAEAAQ